MRKRVRWLLYLKPAQSLRGYVEAHDGQAGMVRRSGSLGKVVVVAWPVWVDS